MTIKQDYEAAKKELKRLVKVHGVLEASDYIVTLEHHSQKAMTEMRRMLKRDRELVNTDFDFGLIDIVEATIENTVLNRMERSIEIREIF